MKLSSQYSVEHRSVSIVQSPYRGSVGMAMIMPGASTCCGSSSSCSCGALSINKVRQ